MDSNPQFSRKYALSILTGIVLCSTALSSSCSSYLKKQSDHPNAAEGLRAAAKDGHDHPNTTKGTEAAVKEIVAVMEKSLADLPPPPSAPAVCKDEMTKLRGIKDSTRYRRRRERQFGASSVYFKSDQRNRVQRKTPAMRCSLL
jgi:hypothetical protein